MAERPLLLLPTPYEDKRQTKPTLIIPPNYHIPDIDRQKDRLTPKLQEMLDFFIADSADGLEPEYALVIEAVGEIEDFQKAATAVGMEWLAEIDEETDPDDDFYLDEVKIRKHAFADKYKGISKDKSKEIWLFLDENGIIANQRTNLANEKIHDKSLLNHLIGNAYPEISDHVLNVIDECVGESRKKNLVSRLYLGMSNRECMDQVLSLWNKWDKPDKKFPRGKTKWRDIFAHLKTIRKWDVEDRLREFDILTFWKEEIEIKRGTSSTIKFEIELWFQTDKAKRENTQRQIERLILDERGKVITTCVIEDIRFHGIKAELPPESVEKAIHSQYTALFKSNDVMFFRPVGQCAVRGYDEDGVPFEFDGELDLSGDPVAALLDGYPMANHDLLAERLIIDDPDDFGAEYQVSRMAHGTAMASLICHDELDRKNVRSLTHPLYVRPIMRPDKNNPDKWEYVPEDVFFEDIIERSVRRMFDKDGEQPPVAKSVKVINLSVCNNAHMFFHRMSSCARLIDWLSEKYQVLFCVSAGNITDDIELADWKGDSLFESENCTDRFLTTIIKNNRQRRMMSPAESINAITVGAIHRDYSSPEHSGNLTDLLPDSSLASPITAHGLGFRNAIKPDIYFPGGRQFHLQIGNEVFRISETVMSPGQRVAAPGRSGTGEINRTVYTRGTSNAAALTTRNAVRTFDVLEDIRNIYNQAEPISDKNLSVLIKTLLVHGAEWGIGKQFYEKILEKNGNKKQMKTSLARYMGYGVPDIQKALACTHQRATAIGGGKIGIDQKHEYRFPLPPSLKGSTIKRRLIITLAWFSPINPGRRKYRMASLFFEVPKEGRIGDRINADHHQVKNGTVQHEIFEGEKAISGDNLSISVICKADAGEFDKEVRYGLAVTLEVAEGVDIPVYEEVKERIGIEVAIKG